MQATGTSQQGWCLEQNLKALILYFKEKVGYELGLASNFKLSKPVFSYISPPKREQHLINVPIQYPQLGYKYLNMLETMGGIVIQTISTVS